MIFLILLMCALAGFTIGYAIICVLRFISVCKEEADSRSLSRRTQLFLDVRGIGPGASYRSPI